MRYLAVALILLNLLYFVIRLREPVDPGAEPETVLRNTGIVLLREVGEVP